MKINDFVARCDEHLGASERATLRALLDDRPDPHPFVQGWRNAEQQVRNAMASCRATRRRKEAPEPLAHEGYDVSIIDAVEEAFRAANPLTREQALDALRFRLIDDLRGHDQFATATLFAYGLKLRAAWRHRRIDAEAGQERLEHVLEAAEKPENDQ